MNTEYAKHAKLDPDSYAFIQIPRTGKLRFKVIELITGVAGVDEYDS